MNEANTSKDINARKFEIPDKQFPWSWPQIRSIAVWIILPLAIGILLSNLIPQPIIGLIRLSDAIHSYTASNLIAQIHYAIDHPEIRAVVLVLDSPGGTVADTEAVYLELARLRQSKPVVTLVQGMAASGAYYLAVGTDYITVSPSSMVGNVGVIAHLPPRPIIEENIATTGPYKIFGTPRDTFMREMEMIKHGFYKAVTIGRGEKLQIGPEILLRGQIWLGSEAVRLGVVDGLGSQSEAVEQASRLAYIRHYTLIEIIDLIELPEISEYSFFIETPEGIQTPYPKEPGLYLLYIPPLERRLP
jgi:protease-4